MIVLEEAEKAKPSYIKYNVRRIFSSFGDKDPELILKIRLLSAIYNLHPTKTKITFRLYLFKEKGELELN